jgi:predicted Zn finger-like uncharacterized protein
MSPRHRVFKPGAPARRRAAAWCGAASPGVNPNPRQPFECFFSERQPPIAEGERFAVLIVCPACASQYRIEADRVGMDGRSVRCAACRETWFITPADVLAGRAEELDIERFGADALAEAGPHGADASDAVVDNVPPRPRAGARTKARTGSAKARRGLAGISPAAAAALVLMAALPLALLARSTVVRAMPQTAGLYARIGLPVNLRGV